jgi:predicted phage terminase large subunit-like protein
MQRDALQKVNEQLLANLSKAQLREIARLAEQEQAKRKASADLTAWCKLSGYVPALHQQLLINALQNIGMSDRPIEKDPTPRSGPELMDHLNLPGGHSTSPPKSSPVKLRVGQGNVSRESEAVPLGTGSGGSLVRGVRSGGRLMVFMPPGSAKSTYCSVLFPAWFIGQDWGGNVLAASHSTELAERFGRKVRNLIGEHGGALGTNISGDSGAAGRWETTAGREYYAAGAGVGIAGFRAKLGIIDDPFRGRADAESKTIRDRIWEWYNDDFDTRCIPGAHQILIMTRYHEDDLAGRLLLRGGWDVISLPAIAGEHDQLGRSPGEWLWEGEYGYAEQLRSKYATSDPRSWASLYQQNPVPDKGAYFDGSWLRPVRFLPEKRSLRYYGASDYAVTQSGGDFTVHLVVGIDPKGRLYLVDLWRGQTDSAEWVSAWCDLVKKWRPFEWAEERGQILSSIGPFLERVANEKRAFTYRRQFPSKHDKAVRAQSIRARMSMGGLYVPAGASWLSEFEQELLRFPSAVHDDQVDALGLIGQLLDHIQAPVAETEDNVIDLPRDDYEFAEYEDEDDNSMETNWKVL